MVAKERPAKKKGKPDASIEDAGGVWFKVEGLVANGERSVVRRASVNGSNDRIAIKILPSEMDAKGTVLPREVLAMRMLDHPSVLHVKKVFYDTKRTFICMTLWAGGNVLDRTLEMGFAEEDAVIVVQDVLDALDHIHSRGLIHCAVEPANIYLVSGDPISGDFNHAVLGGLQRAKTQVLNVEPNPGDLNYVSPELVGRFSKSVGIGPEADMWSVGATLYLMLSGCTPFSMKGNAELQETIKAADVRFTSPFWDLNSRLAKDFISQLLTAKGYNRMTSKMCREHAWMQAALEINKRTPPVVLRAELTLRRLLIFKDIDDECLHDLAARVNFVKFSNGKWIAKRGRSSNSIFFVHSGQVKVFVEGIEIDVIQPGGFFGEAAFMTTRVHLCDYISEGQRWLIGRHYLKGKDETELFEVQRRDIDIIIDRFPILKERLLAVGSAAAVKMFRALQIVESETTDSTDDLDSADPMTVTGDDGESVEISPHGDNSRDDSLDEDGNAMHIAQNAPAAGRDKRSISQKLSDRPLLKVRGSKACSIM